LEEKDVISSAAIILSDLCGPQEWVSMNKLHEVVRIFFSCGEVSQYTSFAFPLFFFFWVKILILMDAVSPFAFQPKSLF